MTLDLHMIYVRIFLDIRFPPNRMKIERRAYIAYWLTVWDPVRSGLSQCKTQNTHS